MDRVDASCCAIGRSCEEARNALVSLMLSADGGFTGSLAFTRVDFVTPGRMAAWLFASAAVLCAVAVFIGGFTVDGVLAFPAGFLSVSSAADAPGFAFLGAAVFFAAESVAGAVVAASQASVRAQGSNRSMVDTTTTRDVDLLLNSFAPANRIQVEPYDRKSLLKLPLLAFKAYLYDSKLRQPLAVYPDLAGTIPGTSFCALYTDISSLFRISHRHRHPAHHCRDALGHLHWPSAVDP
jgi:hypothetical protein